MIFVTGATLMLVREAWEYFVPAVPLVYLVLPDGRGARRRFRTALMIASLAGVAGLGMWFSAMGERYVMPAEDAIFGRILDDESAKPFFLARGMPTFDHLAADCQLRPMTGGCPITDEELDWIRSRGWSTYVSWLRSRPLERIAEFTMKLDVLFSGESIYQSIFEEDRPGYSRLAGIFSVGNMSVPSILRLFGLLVVLSSACLLTRIKAFWPDPCAVVGATYIVLGFANGCLTYWGDPVDGTERHVLMPELVMHLGTLFLVLALADRLVERLGDRGSERSLSGA